MTITRPTDPFGALAPSHTRELPYCRLTGRRLPPGAGAAPPPGSPTAVLVADDGTTLPVFGDVVLGRAPDHDRRILAGQASSIQLADPGQRLSRCHALLRVRGWRVEVADLGSRNGTHVAERNDGWERITPGIAQRVGHGARIRLADRTLTIHLIRR